MALLVPKTASADPPAASSRRRGLEATIVLTITAACAAMLLLIPAAVLIHPATHLPGALANLGDQNQSVKTTLYVLAFLVVVPASVVLVPRVADRIRDGANGPALGLLAALLAAALAVAVMLGRASARLPWGDGSVVVLTLAAGWWLLAGAVVALALRPRPWPALLRAAPLTPVVTGAAVVGMIGAVLSVTVLSRLSAVALVVGALALVVCVALYRRVQLPALSGASAIAMEFVIAVVLVLAIPDLNIFKPAATAALTHFNDVVIEGQENFLLGPANQLLAGGTMLVNTFSQYGVASIYFLAGWFHVAPIGYGTLGFLDGVLTALLYLAGYVVLRLAGVSKLLAAASLGLAVIALLYNLTYPVGALAEHGPVRFGLPMIALAAVAAGVRFPRWTRSGWWTAIALLAVASLWSIEAFAYTAFTLAAMACVNAFRLPAGSRIRWLRGQAVAGVLAVAAVQAAFALATVLAVGQLPDWGEYFAYFKAFLSGSVAYLTYGFARWSPGLAVAAVYLASAISIPLIIWRAPAFFRARAGLLITVAGTTSYGIALFSYFDNRSATYLVLYVALPALLTATLWLALGLQEARTRSPWMGRGLLTGALSLAVIVLAAAWSPIGGRLSDSALAYVVPGGPSLSGALHRLWHPPPLNPLAGEGQRLLARYMPGQPRSLVFTIGVPDLGTEILIRSRRGNRLPLGDPVEDSILPASRLPAIQKAIDTLHPGERLLLNPTAESYVRSFRAHHLSNPLRTVYPEGGTAIEEWALQGIAGRFRLRTVAVDGRGFIVAELAPLS